MSGHPGFPDPDQSRRDTRPTIDLVLADGRTWGLARPELRYRPTSDQSSANISDQAPAVLVRVGYPWFIEERIGRLHIACRGDRGAAGDRVRFDALMALASALLRRAHDLTEAEAGALLNLNSDARGTARLVDAVLDAIQVPSGPYLGGPDA